MIAALVFLYVAMGLCAAAWRAYREPALAYRYYMVEHKWDLLYDPQSSRTFDYPFVLLIYFAFWPIAGSVAVVGRLGESMRRRGIAAHQNQLIRERQSKEDAAEIDRIIREARL